MKYLPFFYKFYVVNHVFIFRTCEIIQFKHLKQKLNWTEMKKPEKKNIHWKKSLEKKAGFQVLKSMTWVLESPIINDFNRFRQKRLIVFDPSTYSTYYTVALFSKRPPENQMTAEI